MRYKRLEGSFDTGRTSALGLNDVWASEEEMIKKRREQKTRRLLERDIVDAVVTSAILVKRVDGCGEAMCFNGYL